MSKQEQEETLVKLTNRNLAKLLDKLEGIGTAEIIKDAIKRQFWFFSTDIKNQVLTIPSEEQENGQRQRN